MAQVSEPTSEAPWEEKIHPKISGLLGTVQNIFHPCGAPLRGTQTYPARKNRKEIPSMHRMVQLYSMLASGRHVFPSEKKPGRSQKGTSPGVPKGLEAPAFPKGRRPAFSKGTWAPVSPKSHGTHRSQMGIVRGVPKGARALAFPKYRRVLRSQVGRSPGISQRARAPVLPKGGWHRHYQRGRDPPFPSVSGPRCPEKAMKPGVPKRAQA